MSNLESTRPGWIGRAIGVGFILLAIGLTVWNLYTPTGWFVLLNVVTLAAGVANFHIGTIRIRKHHELMEEHRRKMAHPREARP